MLQEISYLSIVFSFALSRVVIVALLAAFAILLMDKWGLRHDVVMKTGSQFLSKLFSCDFCMSFWVSMFICVLVFIQTGSIEYLAYPFFATPITRILL